MEGTRNDLTETELKNLTTTLRKLEWEDLEEAVDSLTAQQAQDWLTLLVGRIHPDRVAQIVADDAPAAYKIIQEDER